MAKIAIKSEKLSLFGGFFLIMEEFLSIMEEFDVYSVKTTNNHGWLGWFNKPSIRPYPPSMSVNSLSHLKLDFWLSSYCNNYSASHLVCILYDVERTHHKRN